MLSAPTCVGHISKVEITVGEDRHSPAGHCAQLEGEPTAQLDDAGGARRPCDLAVVARREGRCRVGETHHIEGIGGFGAELEHYSTLELNVAVESQVDIAEPWPNQGIARHIAIGAAGADTPEGTRSVVGESCRIEPRRQHAVGGANPAAVRIKERTNAGNRVGAVRV